MTNLLTGNRWWIYQRERFPLVAHGPLIFAFSFSAVSFSALLRGHDGWPAGPSLAVAFLTSLLFFLQLRIADEFKDAGEDAKYRPYRPVPRGLVRLRELGVIGVAGALVQLMLAWWLYAPLLILLAVTWLYLALMSHEFFARDWLKARPVTYLWTHMLIMPLIDLYATACDWLLQGQTPPAGLHWFLIVSFFNGIVIEIGRKLRAPEAEERGVETYTVLWGRARAVTAWLAALTVTGVFAVIAAQRIGWHWPMAALLSVPLGYALWLGVTFVREPTTVRGQRLELLSGVWTLVLYLGLGAAPMLWRALAGG
ncbi:MAG: UbiA family prenyltransferase [Pseudomonadota bacterium]